MIYTESQKMTICDSHVTLQTNNGRRRPTKRRHRRYCQQRANDFVNETSDDVTRPRDHSHLFMTPAIWNYCDRSWNVHCPACTRCRLLAVRHRTPYVFHATYLFSTGLYRHHTARQLTLTLTLLSLTDPRSLSRNPN